MHSDCRLHTPTHHRKRAQSRGFTLLELMAVVIIISIFATLAAPEVTRRLAERRVSEAAQRVASTYSQARARAMGRGSAVLVRLQNGIISVLEAQLGAAAVGQNCDALPSSSCLRTDWEAPSNYRVLPGLDLANRAEYGTGLNQIQMEVKRSDGSTVVGRVDVCFTPMGRAFFTATGPPLETMTEAFEVVTRRGAAGRAGFRPRNVLVLPNGTARLN